jgi:hypothetical protein
VIRPAWESGGFCEVPAARDRWVPRVGDLIEAGLNEGAVGFARGLWELYFYALANVVAWRGVERRLVVFEVRRGAPSALEKAGGADFDGVGQSEGVRLHRRHRRPRGKSWAKPDHCENHRRQSHDVSHRNGGVGA